MKTGPFQEMHDAVFTSRVWGTVPAYMTEHPRCGPEDEAIAYVIGVRSFPAKVIEFLTRAWTG